MMQKVVVLRSSLIWIRLLPMRYAAILMIFNVKLNGCILNVWRFLPAKT